MRHYKQKEDAILNVLQYLAMNLTKTIKNHRKEISKIYYRLLIRTLNKWRAIHCLCLPRSNTIKISILPKLAYKFNKIPARYV